MHDSAAPRRTARRITPRALAACLIALVAACSDGPTGPRTPAELTVPPITREFRGMWIATVANIDWPQTAGLSASAQQQQLTQLLYIAQQTGINAVILQVRAAGDALYPSSIEPWAKALMGAQ
nr:family 10 glycosylhydrolase [Gemmatimonadaceae bacterium]